MEKEIVSNKDDKDIRLTSLLDLCIIKSVECKVFFLDEGGALNDSGR